MYLHLGSDAMIPVNKIIGIFDLPTIKLSSLRMKELSALQAGEVEKYASFILTDSGLFFSEISAITLKKRAENMFAQEIINQ